MRIVTSLLAILALAGCLSPTIVVAGYERLEPPPAWAARYAELAACAGVKPPPFSLLRFYTAQLIHHRDSGEWESYGETWVRPFDVLLRADKAHDGGPIGHAMMHAIEQTGKHTAAFARCGVP